MSRVHREAAGQWIRVQFWDHVMGDKKPMLCEAAGLVVAVNSKSFTLSWWTIHDADAQTRKDNEEKVGTILQSTVAKWGYCGCVWR